jgi:hypothetical protein
VVRALFAQRFRTADAARTIYSRWLLVIAAIGLLLLPACTQHERHRRGAATPDRVVAQYLQAIEAKDEKAIVNLGLETTDISAPVKQRLARFDCRQINQRQITYLKSKPTLWTAKIRGTCIDTQGNNQNFSDSIVLAYQSKGEVKLYAGRWYLGFDDR